jgi:Copper amine oxidase, N3 domain
MCLVRRLWPIGSVATTGRASPSQDRVCASGSARRSIGDGADGGGTLGGVTDFSLAMIDPWPAGYYGAQDHYDNSALICRPLTFMRAAPSEHGYARSVEGLIVTLDLDATEVTDVEDHGVVPLPPTAGNYAEQFMFDPNNRPAFSDSVPTSRRSRSPMRW